MNQKIVLSFIAGVFCLPVSFAAQTSEREWTSKAGTTISAAATRIKGDKVDLKTNDGRNLSVSLSQLIEADQALLKKHFADAPLEGSGSALATGLAHPQGKVVGPIKTGNSHYFVYVPTSLREGRKAPLLIYSGAGGGSAKSLKDYTGAAEIAGWVLAASVESKNGPKFPEGNYKHAEACYQDLLGTLPIDKSRVYFAGGSGGGAQALLNCDRLNGAGAMPGIGYLPDGAKLSKSAHYYSVGGAWDFNRYLTAKVNKSAGKNGFHRFNSGGHAGATTPITNDGLLWLNSRYLGEHNSPGFDDETADFDKALLDWLRKIKVKEPHRAYYWANFHRQGDPAFALLASELEKDPINVKYVEGLEALDKLSKDILAGIGESGSLLNHSSPVVTRAAGEIAEKYAGVPEIADIAKAMQKPTASPKRK